MSDSDYVTDFDIDEDILNFSFLNAIASANAVFAASSAVTVDGVAGIQIDLGGGESLFLAGLELNDMLSLNYVF